VFARADVPRVPVARVQRIDRDTSSPPSCERDSGYRESCSCVKRYSPRLSHSRGSLVSLSLACIISVDNDDEDDEEDVDDGPVPHECHGLRRRIVPSGRLPVARICPRGSSAGGPLALPLVSKLTTRVSRWLVFRDRVINAATTEETMRREFAEGITIASTARDKR